MNVYQIVELSCMGDESVILETYLDIKKAEKRASEYRVEAEKEDSYNTFIIDVIEAIE